MDNISSQGCYQQLDGGREASLDIIANFASPCSVEPSFDELTQFCDLIFRAYQLHGHIRRIWTAKEGRRVRACHYSIRGRRNEDDPVEIYRDPARSRAMYQNLQTCSSVWSCPLCAPKIAKRRSIEMRHITTWARSEGYRVLMMTLTSRHSDGLSLKWLLECQKRALRQLRSGKRTLNRILPYAHFIRAREVTHGKQGWHPHYHELLITKAEETVEDLTGPVFSLWRDVSVSAGLAEPVQAAFDLTDCNERIGEYISKFGREPEWTEAEEVTLGTRKKARYNNLTPWGLLHKSQDDPKSRFLWCEYAEAVQQLNQLRCSPGLKAASGLKEKTDEQLVKEAGQSYRQHFANVPQSIWDLARDRYRAELLQVAASGELEGFNDYLIYLAMKVEREVRSCSA